MEFDNLSSEINFRKAPWIPWIKISKTCIRTYCSKSWLQRNIFQSQNLHPWNTECVKSGALEGGLIFRRSLIWDEVLQPACCCFEKVTWFHLALVLVMDLELRLPAWKLIPNNGKRLSLKGTRKKSVQLGMNWLSQSCDCIVFLPLTFSVASA